MEGGIQKRPCRHNSLTHSLTRTEVQSWYQLASVLPPDPVANLNQNTGLVDVIFLPDLIATCGRRRLRCTEGKGKKKEKKEKGKERKSSGLVQLTRTTRYQSSIDWIKCWSRRDQRHFKPTLQFCGLMLVFRRSVLMGSCQEGKRTCRRIYIPNQ